MSERRLHLWHEQPIDDNREPSAYLQDAFYPRLAGPGSAGPPPWPHELLPQAYRVTIAVRGEILPKHPVWRNHIDTITKRLGVPVDTTATAIKKWRFHVKDALCKEEYEFKDITIGDKQWSARHEHSGVAGIIVCRQGDTPYALPDSNDDERSYEVLSELAPLLAKCYTPAIWSVR